MSGSSVPRHAPAAQRNREPILAELKRVLPADGVLLEIASGTGEHAAFMACRLPGRLEWQPSDADPGALRDIDEHARASGCPRIRRAVPLDVTAASWPIQQAAAIFCCNMLHIAPWSAAQGLYAGASRILPAGGPLILYGPFKRNGVHTAPSNEAFDTGLRAQNPGWGVRCLDTQVAPLAEKAGFEREETVAMPANNLIVVFRRR